ncbi:hypothetical protein SELMODRAFT_432067 [Selaginella moellendorffii]|uniref:Fanconi-associated nuclease n=1 Tax=Selaginella moellendorffii TaxID=88036 RepID=D8TEW0_SELML|nr:hypothetical protein SELMODRAFT_432067 [Selaginella moellendorffii]
MLDGKNFLNTDTVIILEGDASVENGENPKRHSINIIMTNAMELKLIVTAKRKRPTHSSAVFNAVISAMLRGRESLIRLVGKRQRNVSLPAREELECGDVSLEIKGGLSLACCDWVECPVCGKQIRGNELLVNCHLDTCLQSGKKKKNNVQHTLFHFNLSKKIEYEESGNCVLEIQQSPPLETGVDCNTAAGSPKPEVSSTLECFEEPDVANSVLPAERYLSPLMEKGVVDVQGYVSESTLEAARLKLDLREIQNRTIGSLSEEKVLAVKWSRLMDAADKGQDRGCQYQQNFLYMLQVVLERDLHLFTPDEIELLEAFRSISSDGQRLGSTKGGTLLSFRRDVNSSELLEHLTVRELKDLAVNSKIMIKSAMLSLKKIQLITAIRDALISLHFNLTALIREATGPCIRIAETVEVLLWHLQRLFFLNGEQEFHVFLLVDIGRIKYPGYRCARTMPVFSSREDFLAYEQHPFLARFSAAWVYATTVAASFLEKERRYAEAVNLFKQLLSMQYCPGRRGYWTLRQSIDLEHLQRLEESLLVAENGLNDFNVRGGDRIALQRRVLRLDIWPSATTLFLKVTIMGRPLNNANGMKSRFYGYDGQQCSVEDLALQYYAGEDGGGWKGTAPLDLCTDSFYPVRSSLIESRLQAIRDGGARQLVAETWAEHYGTSCSGVNWEKYSLEDLQTITVCIGGPGLSVICKLLAEDHSNWTAGMPDLLLWKEKEAKLAEVKGPGDRLSEQQVACFLILSDANVPVELCKDEPNTGGFECRALGPKLYLLANRYLPAKWEEKLVLDVFQTHFRDCTIGLVHGFLSIQSEARLLNLLFKPYAMVELGNSSWKHSGRVNWENEDLHTITGLSVIHMLLAENQGGQNWSKPRVREIACPSNRHSHNWWHLELCHLEGGPAENVLRIFDTRIWGDHERAERDTFAVSLNALEFLLCLQVNRFGDHITKLFVDKRPNNYSHIESTVRNVVKVTSL